MLTTGNGMSRKLSFVPLPYHMSQSRQGKPPTHSEIQMRKSFRELNDTLSVQNKLIPPAPIVSFRIILHNTPVPEDFPVTGNDLTSS